MHRILLREVLIDEGLGATVRTRYDDYAVMLCLVPPVPQEFATRATTV